MLSLRRSLQSSVDDFETPSTENDATLGPGLDEMDIFLKVAALGRPLAWMCSEQWPNVRWSLGVVEFAGNEVSRGGWKSLQ